MAALLIKLFIKDRDNVKDKNVRKKYGYLGSCTGIVLNIMLFLGKLVRRRLVYNVVGWL